MNKSRKHQIATCGAIRTWEYRKQGDCDIVKEKTRIESQLPDGFVCRIKEELASYGWREATVQIFGLEGNLIDYVRVTD